MFVAGETLLGRLVREARRRRRVRASLADRDEWDRDR